MTSEASPLRRWTTREQLRGAGARFLQRGGILIPFLALFLALSLTSEPFATAENMRDILDQQATTLIIAAAGTLVLVAGGIDLSVGAIYVFGGVTSANLALSHSAGWSIVVGIGAGLVVGLANGIVVTVFRINSLIATLAMAFIITGCSSLMTGGNLIVLFNKTAFGDFAKTEFLGIKTLTWVMVAAVVVLAVLLAATTAGRYMYAAGGNAEAARLAGVRVNWIRILTFTISGTAAGLAGVLATANVGTAQAATQDTLTFTVLAGIVVGGTSILGGEGAVWKTVVGVLFIALIGNGYVLLGWDPLYQQITLGVLLLLAVALDALARGLLRPGVALKQLFRRHARAP
jgi:ribose transport system permease protein